MPAVTATYEPYDPAHIADPYPAYREMHAAGRVHHLPQWALWVLVRHDDVAAAVRAHGQLSSAEGVTFLRAPLPMMLTMDPPDHGRLRRLAGREFAPRDIHRFRPDVERFVREGFEALRDGGDVVRSLSMPVPIRVMAGILGVDETDIPRLQVMADNLVHGLDLRPDGNVSQVDLQRVGGAIVEIHAYFTDHIGRLRARPGDDIVSRLMTGSDEGALSNDELLWFCLLLLVAGIETTTNLISNMFLAFAAHPDEYRAVRDNPELVPSAVAEALRYDSPIQGFFRTARTDYTVGDVTIPAGSRVLMSFGAANRDPSHYDDPDAFRADRNPTDHLAFGGGIHRCLGAGLAELEGRVVLEHLIASTDVVELAGEVVRNSNTTLRGALRLPVSTKGWAA